MAERRQYPIKGLDRNPLAQQANVLRGQFDFRRLLNIPTRASNTAAKFTCGLDMRFAPQGVRGGLRAIAAEDCMLFELSLFLRISFGRDSVSRIEIIRRCRR